MPGGVELPKVTRKRLAMWWWNFLEIRISTLRNKIERLIVIQKNKVFGKHITKAISTSHNLPLFFKRKFSQFLLSSEAKKTCQCI